MSLPLAFLTALVLTPVLAGLALGLGWVDRREGAEHRKPRRSPVPLVGGAAVLAGCVAAGLGGDGLGLAWPALVGAFLLGLVDDVRPGGLKASVKLTGQLAVAVLVFVAPGAAWTDASVWTLLGLAALSVVAMNAVNTFDHQDGVAGVTSGLALATGAPALTASIAGYLPFNTFVRRRSTDGESVPIAMLGDSGSHLLGVAIATTPGAAVVLLVPLLDLARVVRARMARGQPFWVGDRTHLGHRLAGLGFGPVAVAALVAVIVAPPVLTTVLSDSTGAVAVGLALSALLFLVAIVATADGALEEPASDGPAPKSGVLRPEQVAAPEPRPAEVEPASTAGAAPAGPRESEESRGPEDEPPLPEPDVPTRHPLTGSPSTGSPSKGSPSKGSPSKGSPSKGSSSKGAQARGPSPPAGPFAESDPTS